MYVYMYIYISIQTTKYMKCTPTPNEFLAEAQARQLSRDCGVAYLNYTRGLYLATVGKTENVLFKFENGKKVSI